MIIDFAETNEAMTEPDLTSIGDISVVVADDHPITREGTRRILDAHAGIRVVGTAENGQELVDLVVLLRPRVAVVDVAMPVMNGIDATKQIKSEVPSTAVLVLSAYDSDMYVFALLAAGAAGYLLKDASADSLVDAVRRTASGESVLSTTVAAKVLARVAGKGAGPGQTGAPAPERLTERELEVLQMVARGLTNAEIAKKLTVSIRTVQAHLTQVFVKLNVASRTEAVIAGLRKSILTMEDIGQS